MVKVIGAIVLGIIAIVCFVISFLQFNEKGFLFNNAYIGASKQDRETMNKKPHYKQSGIVFALIGIIFLINTVEIILQTKWLFYLGTAVEIAVVVYAIVSSIAIEKRKNNMNEKMNGFFENARLISEELGIIPLMYGSLGLEYLTGKDLNADDIDILIPEAFITEKWDGFKNLLEKNGYVLTDESEHTFDKNGVHYSYAGIEDLEPFAEICISDIAEIKQENTRFKLLSLEQYLKVYTASAKDGYRTQIRNKKDSDKIKFIQEQLEI